MKVEDQVCSLELAKRLKELGTKQESLFYWNVQGTLEYAQKDFIGYTTDISAFTVAELGEMLPAEIGGDFIEYWKKHWQGGINYMVSHKEQGTSSALTEADARAKCLIHLIENGIVKL